MMARFSRIYPVFLLSVLATGALVAYCALRGGTLNPNVDYTLSTFVANLLMLQPLPGIESWSPPLWSVGAEMVAYVLFPFAAAVLVRLGRRTALVLLAALLVLEIAGIAALGHVTQPPYGLFWLQLAGGFPAGCLLWAAWRHGVRPHWRWDVVAVTTVVATLVLYAVQVDRLGLAEFLSRPVHGLLAMPFVVVFVAAVASATGGVRSVLASRPVEWSGRFSYSLYLVHTPVLTALYLFFPPARFATAAAPVKALAFLGYFGATLVVGAVTYRAVEEPARRWLRRRTSAWSAPGTAGSPGSTRRVDAARTASGSSTVAERSPDEARASR